MNRYIVNLVLINRLGKFVGKKYEIDESALSDLINKSKLFYDGVGFELTCEDNSYAILPPSIVQESILIINKEIIM